MPRISKRDKIQEEFMRRHGKHMNMELKHPDKRLYLVAGYERLSRFNSGNDDNDTIENQKKTIETYIDANADMKLAGHYADNGFTGSDFERPQWKLLMKELNNGTINCIIFKDFSRLGRNFLETSEYIAHIFPQLGIRIISIMDDYDSNAPVRDEDGILIPLKNLMNELYMRDIREKGKAVRERKMREGEYTRAVAPYGYVRAGDKDNTLRIDEDTAWIVKQIFQWRKEEHISAVEIATRLNSMEIAAPKKYQHMKGLRQTKDNLSDINWSAVTIRRILSNKVYCGCLIQGKVQGRGKKTKRLDESKWYQKECAHEAIISIEDFESVQNTFPDKCEQKTGKGAGYNNFFAGLLFCHECGSRMISRYGKDRDNIHYVCKRHMLESKEYCKDITFGMKTLSCIILTLLEKVIVCALEEKAFIEKVEDGQQYQSVLCEYQTEISHLHRKIENNLKRQACLYEDYASDLLGKEEYRYNKMQYIKEEKWMKQQLSKQLHELEKYKNVREKIKTLIHSMNEFSFKPTLTKEFLHLFVDRIEIGKEHTLYVSCSFRNILNAICTTEE